MSDCRFGVSPVNYPDPERSLQTEVFHLTLRLFSNERGVDTSLSRTGMIVAFSYIILRF